MNKIRTDGIIFDMDGTIWDNTPVFAPSWERACKECGYDVRFTPDILKRLFGKTMTDIADECIPDSDTKKRYEALELCERYEMDDLAKAGIDTTYPGLGQTLEVLGSKTRLFIVSNCQSGYIEAFFELSGLKKYFSDYICYGDNGLGKADNIKLLVERNKIVQPVYIGDIQGDKDACDLAGVDFIWAAYGYGTSVDAYVASVDNISELGDIIDGI